MSNKAPYNHPDGSPCYTGPSCRRNFYGSSTAVGTNTIHSTEGGLVADSGNKTTARQKHGFLYEDDFRVRYNLIPLPKNTDPWDAVTNEGKFVSIKTKQYKSAVELASWKRHLNITKDFYLVVGFWQQQKTNIVEELIMDIPHEEWARHFPTHYVDRIAELFKGVSHERSWDPIWKARMSAFQERYQQEKLQNNWIVNLAPKRDHKGQLRMQCSIPYVEIKKLYNKYGVTSIGG